jgi:hypothetical protein
MRSFTNLAAALAVCLAGAFATTPAVAARPDEPPGQAKKQERAQRPPARTEVTVGAYFREPEREAARGYYKQRYVSKCPPGLAKKNNGCLPPGQAKKYELGQRLPRDIIYYPVPPGVLMRLPPVPAGHEYVRVATDILLITIGTHMVIDAITDLMGR